MRLTKERESEIRRCMSCHETELFYEIDALRAEIKRNTSVHLWNEAYMDLQNERDTLKFDYGHISTLYEEERDALQLIVENQTGEILNLQTERDDYCKLNYRLADADYVLKARIEKLRSALEKIGYWKSDANICCFPIDCYGVLAADEEGK